MTSRFRPKAIVIGASAGALEVLSSILPVLPENYPAAILIVVHIPPDRPSLLAELLGAKCRVQVKEADDKEPVRAGTAYIAPPDYHLLVERDHRLSLSTEEPVRYSRPSVDVLFESAADAYGPDLVGVVLTGANDDGARGLNTVIAAGGVGLVQNPGTAYARAMPEAALSRCPTADTLTIEEITEYLLALGRSE